jgi:hypothetical protein
MRIVSIISFSATLLACEASTGVSQRSKTEYGSSPGQLNQEPAPASPQPDAETQLPWIGIVPEKAVVTTQRTLHNMTFIDSDMSMGSELNYGLMQLTQEAAKVDKKQTQTGFEVVSADQAFVVVDNSFNLFRDGERTTVINKPLTNTSLKTEIIQVLTTEMQKDPDYAKKIVPSLIILTDGDIPAVDQQELSTFLSQNFPDGQAYVHLIASPDAAPPTDSWCQPEARPENLISLRQQFPNSLRLSICDADWYGHFRSVGKRVIYDHGVARMILPAASIVPGAVPHVRFNFQAFPSDLMQYDPELRQIQIRLVDMPSNIQTIEIGFKP